MCELSKFKNGLISYLSPECDRGVFVIADIEDIFALTFQCGIASVRDTIIRLQRQLELSENLTMAPLQCLAWSKMPECLRILSGNVILTSIRAITPLQICEK